MKEVLNKIKDISILSLFLSYIFGFIIWNSFLNKFGFFEYNLLQTRYISAGAIFIIIHFSLGFFIFKLTKPVKLFHKYLIKLLPILIGLFILIYLPFIYTKEIFPIVPQSVGGGRPETISIMGDYDQIEYLKNFDITPAENSEGTRSVQTDPVCSLYQNKDFIVIGVAKPTGNISTTSFEVISRIIILKQEQFRGIQSYKGKDLGFPCRVNLR